MWNTGYNFWEHQNGYGYNNEFNSYQQGNQYSDFYKQQQPDLYPEYYQPPSLQEPYFTSSEQYYPPQDQPTDEFAEIRALMLQGEAMMQQILEEHNAHNENFARLMAHNERMDNRFDSHVASESDQFEVLSNDFEVKIVGEDINEEEVEVEDCSDEEENAENKKSGENRSVSTKTDRFLPNNKNQASEPIGFHKNRSVFPRKSTETPKIDRSVAESSLVHEKSVSKGESKEPEEQIEIKLPFPCRQRQALRKPMLEETVNLIDTIDHVVNEMRDPLEALMCLDSCADTIDTNSAILDALEAALHGKMLTREQSERVRELTHTAYAAEGRSEMTENNSKTDWLPPEATPDVDSTCLDSFEDDTDPYNEELHHGEPSSSPTCVDLRYEQGKESVWGRLKNFELTGEGDYGGYLGRSFGGFRDQFYIDPGSSTGGIWSRKEYHGPWFND